MGMTKKEVQALTQPLIDEIGGMLREMRGDLNLTQRDFAEQIGSCQNHVSLMENGKTNPSIGYLSWYAANLDYHLEVSFVKVEEEEEEE